MDRPLNYRHLYYFWVVAKVGGISRAAARLGLAVQTVSSQVRELENSLGCILLKPVGRGVSLTEAGLVAVKQADQIFELGDQLQEAVRGASRMPAVRLVVGIADTLPKVVIQRLMAPVMGVANLRLRCDEGQFEDLLAHLALHRLDIVLADRAAPSNPNLKLYSHSLGSSRFAWYSPSSLYASAKRGFPSSLAKVPVLLPSKNAAVRARLDEWLARRAIHPRLVGEFEDSALLKTFGADGMGVFPAVELTRAELTVRYKVKHIGDCDGVKEEYFAVRAEKKIGHPLVERLLAARR